MFLSIEQIKAARALLKWTQKDLAHHASLNDDQVHSFESGRTRSLDVLEAIYEAFTTHGIDFADGGVRPGRTKIVQLWGEEGFEQFMDDVYKTSSLPEDPNLSILNVNNEQFIKWLDDKSDAHVTRMSNLNIEPARCIVPKNYKTDIAKAYSNYKSVDPSMLGEGTLYLYGHKAAIIIFDEENVEVTIVENIRTTTMLRHMFETIWVLAREDD